MSIFKIEIAVSQKDFDAISILIYKYDIQGIVEHDTSSEKRLEVFVASSDKEALVNELSNSDLLIGQPQVSNADDNKDWVKDWKDSYEDIDLCGYVIRPPWSTEFTEDDIIINPSMGFGTGKHETTQLAAKLIKESVSSQKPRKFLDVGTGSGILAFLAEKLEVTEILGIDIDADAIGNAQENHKLNTSNYIVFRNEELPSIAEQYDLVCANIIAEVLLNIKLELKRVLANNGTLVICGVHQKFINDIKASYSTEFKINKVEQLGEWFGISLSNQ